MTRKARRKNTTDSMQNMQKTMFKKSLDIFLNTFNKKSLRNMFAKAFLSFVLIQDLFKRI